MKLGFVSDFYYPSIGGTQMLCKGIAEWFRDQGHEIEIITSGDENRKDMGYVVNELPGASFVGADILYKKKYDAVFVLADLFSPSILSLDTEQVEKTILILNLDENVYRWIREGKIKDLKQRVAAIKKYSHVVSFCQGAPVNKFLEENKIKYTHIPNFSWDVQKENREQRISKEFLNINNKIIFNHGRWHPRKNQISLIKSYAQSGLTEEYTLVILGSCENREEKSHLIECNKFIDKNNLKSKVKLIKGTNNRSIINSLLIISDIYFMPSLSEGLPLVLLEAMSAGLPWVSTPCGGVPGVFGKLSGGHILNTFEITPEVLENSIRLVEQKNSRIEWESLFSVDIVCSQYMKLLLEGSND
jgi:glycosyltransferase involved in cell wall biosynthesis